jgi:hypothetical protein
MNADSVKKIENRHALKQTMMTVRVGSKLAITHFCAITIDTQLAIATRREARIATGQKKREAIDNPIDARMHGCDARRRR